MYATTTGGRDDAGPGRGLHRQPHAFGAWYRILQVGCLCTGALCTVLCIIRCMVYVLILHTVCSEYVYCG